MRKPRSRPRRIPTNRPRIDCSGASSQLWLSKISTSERMEDLGTRGGDCGTARRVAQGALKLILEPIFEDAFQTGSYGYRPKRTAHPEPLSKSVGKRLAPRALTSNEACDHVGVLRAVTFLVVARLAGESEKDGNSSAHLILKPARLLAKECGFVGDPSDFGGETSKGVNGNLSLLFSRAARD